VFRDTAGEVVIEPEQRERESATGSPALQALTEASRALAEGAGLTPTLDALVAAVARATGANLVIARVLDPDGRRASARAVFSTSPALVAELEGTRLDIDDVPATPVDELGDLPETARLAAERAGAAAVLLVPVRVRGAVAGTLEVVRTTGRFDAEQRALAQVVADQVGVAVRSQGDGDNGAVPAARMLQVAGEALETAADARRGATDLARLALEATGARACVLWAVDPDSDDVEEVAAAGADVGSDRDRARELALSVREGREATRVDAGDDAVIATVQVGEPSLGALQLLFEPEAAPGPDVLERLGTFAARAARALAAAERARALGLELERMRALLGVVAQANAQLSLAHTLATALDRLGELLAVERVGVYLRDGSRLVAADGRNLTGPHVRLAERLLELALGPFRARGMLLIEDAPRDRRLAGLEDELAATGIEAAVAAPLLVPDDVVGLLALYPRRGRTLTDHEWGLLEALTAQLAVAVQNALLHEQATQLGEERKRALAEQRRDQDKLQALYEISRAFAQSLSLEATLEAIVRTVVELLDLDAAVIRMPDGRGELLVPRASHVADARLDAAIRAILLQPQPLEKLPGRRLFRMGKPLVLDSSAAARLEAHQLLAPFLEKGSTAVVVPIATPSELLGTLTLLSLDPERAINEEKREIAVSVAAQAALALENARLYQQQKEFADTMQRSLLPRLRPRLEGLELGAVYESSARVDVGGDVYDFLVLEDGRLAVCLGDVTGHGIGAAADMAMAKFVFRSLAREHPEPGEFLAVANDVVCGEIASGKFITMLYLTLDPATGELACASAGHPPPRVVRADGSVRVLPARGLALGIDGAQQYDEVREALALSASVVLYTDGVVEARRGPELYGSDRLDALLATRHELAPEALAREIVAASRSFAGGELTDDCAVVVLRRAEAPLAAPTVRARGLRSRARLNSPTEPPDRSSRGTEA
jgi:serine phosphatase RsbU (regulator of sigma subunit)